MSSRLPIQITRENEEIVEDLMEHRNRKVESDADFPASYKAVVYGAGNPSEDAFYDAHTDSHMRMTITPGTGFSHLSDIAKAVQETEDAETELRAKVEGIYEHGPVLQKGIEALEQAGFEPYAELDVRYTGNSISEAVREIEEKGASVDIWASESEINEHPDSHYIRANYHPEENTFSPDVQVCAPAHAEDGEAEELEQQMEEALDEFGLLE